MTATSTAGDPPTRPTPEPDPVLDRAVWERLRSAARLGNLVPEGALLVQELHAQYPAWVEEWSR